MKSQHSPYDIEAQDQAIADAKLKSRLERETEEDDVRWLMGSRRGRRIVWRFLEQAGVFRSSFHLTAMQMAFNEGFRNFGNRLLGLVHSACPDLYPTMMKEAKNGGRNGTAGSRDSNQ